jgi:hypothetical protein
MRLELKLGERWAVATNSIFRTESRYRLCDQTGHILATGESTLALGDLKGDWDYRIVVCSETARNTYFIGEEQSWATRRFILIRPNTDSPAPNGGVPAAWTVKYLWLPEPHDGLPSEFPKILGIHSDRLYMQQDGRVYAFPLDTLEEVANLAYSIG